MPKGVYQRNQKHAPMGPPPQLSTTQDALVSRIYLQGFSVTYLVDLFGVSKSVIVRALRRTHTPRRSRACPGAKNGSWKGGRTIDKTGYVLIHNPTHPHANHGGYVREHRLIMEKILGRILGPKEVVHHKNGIRGDNSPENLILFSDNGIHLAVELMGKVPQWSEDGKKRIRAGKKSRPPSNTPHPDSIRNVNLSRKKLIGQFLLDTDNLERSGPVASPPQLPHFPKKKKTKREKESPPATDIQEIS